MSPPADRGRIGAGEELRQAAALHIGVKAGAERTTADIASFAHAVRDLLDEIAAAAQQAAGARDLYAPGPAILRCISSLESGAERSVARTAVTAGFKLQVPLPDAPAFIAAMFPDHASRADFEGTLAMAEVAVTLDREAVRSNAARQALLGVLLDQSDILLVIEDADDSDSVTLLVREARGRNIPVVVIAAAAPHDIRVVDDAGDPSDWRGGLRRAVAGILDPFDAEAPAEQAALRALPDRYFAERGRAMPWYLRLSTLFERVMLTAWRPPASTAAPIDESDTFVSTAALSGAFRRADTLAIRYAHLYRSAFVLRYLLIVPMAVGMIVGFFALTPGMRTLGFGVQWVAVVGTLAVTRINKKTDWHDRFTTYRFLAELLRHQAYLGRFGRTLPTMLAAKEQKSATLVWVIWQFRSIVRQDGLHAMEGHTVDCEHMAKVMRTFLRAQYDFYRRAAARYGTIANRIWRSSIGLFWGDFIVITLRGGAIGTMRVLGYSTDPSVGPVLDRWEDFLNELDIILPCLAWIILALGDQGEYSRLADQYAGMVENAEALVAELDRTEPAYPALVRIASTAAASLTSEVASWRMLISTREITYL